MMGSFQFEFLMTHTYSPEKKFKTNKYYKYSFLNFVVHLLLIKITAIRYDHAAKLLCTKWAIMYTEMQWTLYLRQVKLILSRYLMLVFVITHRKRCDIGCSLLTLIAYCYRVWIDHYSEA